MIKKILLFLIILIPVNIFAKSSLWSSDTTSKRILENDCGDRIFTKVENIASLKIPIENFEDTFNSFLKSKKACFNHDKITFKFIVTINSHIFDIEKLSGEIRKEDIAKEGILKFSSLWNPAVQNGRNVCSYVKLEMNITRPPSRNVTL